jgi:hypothetical protein
MLSEIWSATLSGCPSVTDSEVKKNFSLGMLMLISGSPRFGGGPAANAMLPLRPQFFLIFSDYAHKKKKSNRDLGWGGPLMRAGSTHPTCAIQDGCD